MAIDNDEALEKMCQKCKHSAEQNKCTHCGSNIEMEINPTFDDEIFEKMKRNAEWGEIDGR